jgi:hypothetical protein
MEDQDGRGALVGEFLQSFFASPKEVQDQIIFRAVKVLALEKTRLIDPYPVLNHLFELLQKHHQ